MILYSGIMGRSLESFAYATLLDRTGIGHGVEHWKDQGLFSMSTLVVAAVGWILFCIGGAIYRRMLLIPT